ncbi:MAG TPA: preprotein translocase subunit YajC [Saprospiraceae bacterium]|nr:preprotein translocase subunit YajC [Saprospiraceae bacterium]
MNTIGGAWPLILMFVVVYFFFIRPQSKKAKEQAEFVKNLKKGDEVVTGSGVIGKISKLDDQSVTLMVDQKSYITFLRSSINQEMTQALESGDKE